MSDVDGGRLRLLTVQHGWRNNEVFVQDLAQHRTITVAQGIDAQFAPQFIDGKLWMRSELDAPKGRIVTVDLAHPEPASWKVIVPEGDDAMDGFSVIDGKLYVTYIHDVGDRIAVYTVDGMPAGEVAVPAHTTASIRGAGKGAALLTLTAFTQPSITWRIDLASGQRTVYEKSDVPFDTAGIEVEQVTYTSKDGTKAPMYVMHRRGIPMDGSRAALLTGYGGFDVSLLPRFDPMAALWVERGGILGCGHAARWRRIRRDLAPCRLAGEQTACFRRLHCRRRIPRR